MSKSLAIFVIVSIFSLNTTLAFAVIKNEVHVKRVIDGDTFVISENFKHVRMAEVDAPEKKQAYGLESFFVLKDKIEGKVVTLDVLSEDKYGRLVSKVYVNGENVNKYIVSEGAAWVYKYYCKDESLYALEFKSKIKKKGLWAADKPMPPWDYRSQYK
ncbi:hypothetical protein E0D81_21760 [Lelliottia amnigena]|uniref:thermonuclease family protein n=1 Tax=Lelliottia amnigena TaxID=61646 RepID=UPI00103D24AB|nr:thermonuclease family protein [Lelliottia amnigena]TCD12263.1 hypothetical protein E0D81_21760 [Lelliottia amnigena]